jgi:hypothetical protein
MMPFNRSLQLHVADQPHKIDVLTGRFGDFSAGIYFVCVCVNDYFQHHHRIVRACPSAGIPVEQRLRIHTLDCAVYHPNHIFRESGCLNLSATVIIGVARTPETLLFFSFYNTSQSLMNIAFLLLLLYHFSSHFSSFRNDIFSKNRLKSFKLKRLFDRLLLQPR